MLEAILFLLIAMLIVMPVVFIVLLGIQRLGSLEWKPQTLAIAAVTITVVLVLAYLFLT